MDKQFAQFVYSTAPNHLGLTESSARAILRAAKTLHTWAEHECNGTKQQESVQDSTGQWVETGRWFWYNPNTGNKIGRAVDLETGALRRVASICKDAGLTFEHQGDPRGCVLKIIKDGRSYGVPS
jgi:hypothetical protein